MNVSVTLEGVKKFASQLTDVFVVSKYDCPPAKLPEVLTALIATGKLSEKQVEIMRQFFDSLLRRPTFMGVGVDLKELGKIKWPSRKK